ncbi:MAG TPA: DNA adenine methylase [Ktedonosporobacter sp.]|jgi:DNA adenine methylase|nr:DNA adenine methylase [Ktedonosporobacter sp.]
MTFTHRLVVEQEQINAQLAFFPSSRYMGSKHAILPFIHEVMKNLEFDTVLDACSGSGAVSYLLKSMGKTVTSNDFLRFCYHTAQAFIANNSELLSQKEVEQLLRPHPAPQNLITRTFEDLYFTESENHFLDNLVSHILEMTSPVKQSIAFAAITRACLRRRPRGVFTYTGVRYNDGRRDLKFTLQEHFRVAVEVINRAVFDNGRSNKALNNDVFQIPEDVTFDLLYLDPPYVSPHSDNDYTRRYHFVEGLSRYWQDLEILKETTTKKFRRIPSLFDTKKTIYEAFHKIFERYRDTIIVVSYSSNGIPGKEELLDILAHYKREVVVYECNHHYSFGTHNHKVNNNQNDVKEFLFVGK